jgi:hypothetical protein
LLRCHRAVRANPCCGAAGACRLAPNHGKMIGMPPRIALPGAKALLRLVKRTGRSPGGQVRSLQVKLARDAVERDRGLDQPVFRFDEIENAGNAEFGGELLGLHRSFLSPKIIIADCGPAAPLRNSARRCRNSPRQEAMQAPEEVAATLGAPTSAARTTGRRASAHRAPSLIHERLQWPPARGRGPARAVVGRAGRGGCGNEIGCPNLMHY